MSIKKRLTALLVVFAMVLTYMPAIAFAEGEGASAVGDAYSIIAPVSAEPVKGDDGYIRGWVAGDIGTSNIRFTGGYGFTVEYSNGDKINYIYDEETDNFVREGAEDPSLDENILIASVDDSDGAPVFEKGWNRDVKMILNVPYTEVNETTHAAGYAGSLNMSASIDIWCAYRVPVSAEFVPAEGFSLDGYIGYNYIDETNFYGEGNAFEVTYDDLWWDDESQTYSDLEYTTTYRYVKTEDGDEGFYEDSNVNHDRFSLSENSNEVLLKKGVNKVTVPFYAFATGSEEPAELTFDVDINATRYNAYANGPVFDYTGKYIKKSAYAKKLVVRDSNDNKIPASEYTYSWKKHKKMGWYEVEIVFKDKTKYVDSITAVYGIGPKTPVIAKVKGGKKKLTVSWKKFTKAQLKNADGLWIEIARNKNFTKDWDVIKVSKKQLKKGSMVIKKLAGGKKYYVRISAFKKIKQDGETYNMLSSDSKIKTAKTKK